MATSVRPAFTMLRFDRHDDVAVITIDMPGRSMNVFDATLNRELDAAIDMVLGDEAIAGAVITSGKRAFLAGADLLRIQSMLETAPEQPAAEVYHQQNELSRIFRKLETGGLDRRSLLRAGGTKPFVAALNGLALGGGFELVLACHHRIASDEGSLRVGLPEVGIGLIPGAGGTQRLPRLAGLRAAIDLLTGARPIAAAKANALGLLDRLVPADRLLEEAIALARTGRALAPWDRPGFAFPGGSAADPRNTAIFTAANGRAQADGWHNYAALEAALSAVFEGSIVDFDTALRLEGQLFCGLVRAPQARRMIETLFIARQAAEKQPLRPEGLARRRVERVGLVGSGPRAQDLADELAAKGIAVVREPAAGLDLVLIAPHESETSPSRLRAEWGDLPILVPLADPAKAADPIDHGPQVVGWHPASAMFGDDDPKVVEIAAHDATTDEALALAYDLARQLGRLALPVNGAQGSLVERLSQAYQEAGEGLRREGHGVALIVNGARLAGMANPPLARADAEATVTSGPADRLASVRQAQSIRRRLLDAVGEAAAAAVEAGHADAPITDLAAIYGVGFPKWSGGPLSLRRHPDPIALSAAA